MKTIIMTTLLAVSSVNSYAQSTPAVEQLLKDYRQQTQRDFSAERGQQFWQREFRSAASGDTRSCTSCHHADPGLPGKHQRTGKLIEAMQPAANQTRLTDSKKIEKWFKRNCTWTLGRTCNIEEKGDVLLYLIQHNPGVK